MTELKGFEENEGPDARPRASSTAASENRKTWLDERSPGRGRARRHARSPTASSSAADRAASRWRAAETPGRADAHHREERAPRRFLAQALQVALPARPGLVRPPALPAVPRPLAGVLAEGQDRRLAGDVRQGHGAELLALHRVPKRAEYDEATQDWTVDRRPRRRGRSCCGPSSWCWRRACRACRTSRDSRGRDVPRARSTIPASTAAARTTAARSASCWAPTTRPTTSAPLCGSTAPTSP